MSDKTEIIEFPFGKIEITRKGKGPQLLLLHGGGGAMANQPFVDILAKKFEIIAPTHPGFNSTEVPSHFDGMDDLVHFYLDVLDALKIENALVMGMSMGGWLATELATISCARFSKLILVDAVGAKFGGPTDRDIVDVFGLPPTEITKLMWHDPSQAPNLADLPNEQVEIIAANRIALGLYTWEPYMHNPKLKYRLHRISIPTLVIWGESDGLVKPDYGKTFAEHIPGAKFHAIPEAGHSPHVEQAQAFINQVHSFTD